MFLQATIPFALGPSGLVATESNPDVQIGQRVAAVVGTLPYERVMLPNFGVPLGDFVFEEQDIVLANLTRMITNALAIWEPGVVVNLTTPVWNKQGDGIAAVEVDYKRTDSSPVVGRNATTMNTALIGVGGTVQENIRG